LILEPSRGWLKGLRFNAQYQETKQRNAIASLSVQTLVALESTYPDRITRNSAGAIIGVDSTYLNLYARQNRGWDLSLDYGRDTRLGYLKFNARESINQSTTHQYSLAGGVFEYAGLSPAEGGSPKHKSALSLGWERGRWGGEWSMSYWSKYKQYGASTLAPSGGNNKFYVIMQGRDTVPSQNYHDVVVSYSFADQPAGNREWFGSLLSGVNVKAGVKNVFDTSPPFDAYYDSNLFLSPYGDLRLRSYWLSLTKSF
jgi:iron complex outermembrane receptor protein